MRSSFFDLFPLRPSLTSSTKLADLLYIHRHAHCTEVIDRVYSLISLSPDARRHLNVEYGVSPISLLNHVLDFCVDKENLDNDRLVWLILLLKRQLSIDNDILESSLNEKYSDGSMRFGDKAMNTVVIHRLGIIPEPGRERSEYEQYLLDSMAVVPPLGKIHRSSWLRCDENVFGMSPADMQTTALPSEQVSNHDLFGFIFEDEDKLSANYRKAVLSPVRVGLSSAWLEPGDQVWQFRRSPTALILRGDQESFEDRFSVVGKAYILRHGETDWCHQPEVPSNLSLDELLSYHEEGMNTTAAYLGYTESVPRQTMHLKLNVPTLLKILDWIDFDHDRV